MPTPSSTASSESTPLTSTPPPPPITDALRRSTRPKTKPSYLEDYHCSLLTSSLHQSDQIIPLTPFLPFYRMINVISLIKTIVLLYLPPLSHKHTPKLVNLNVG